VVGHAGLFPEQPNAGAAQLSGARVLGVYRDTLTRGFSHFVTSMTAPVASGWSGCRVGLTPTGKRRLSTAHTQSGHCCLLKRGGPGCLNRFSASISGASAGVRLPSGVAAG
jgi:hypothetical protein